MKAKTALKNLFLGVSMAWLSISGLDLSEAISYSTNSILQGFAVLLLPFIIAMLYGMCAVSRKSDIGLIRFLISLPFVFLVFLFFLETGFTGNAHKFFRPKANGLSLGEMCGSLGVLGIVPILCITIGLIGVYCVKIKEEKMERFEKIQFTVILIADIVSVITVVVLQLMFISV